MFGVTPEIAASASTYAVRPKQTHSEPAPSDGFAALIDNAVPADRAPPPPVQPQRLDSDARGTDRRDAPNAADSDKTQAASAPKDATDDTISAAKGTDQSTQADKTATTGQAPAKEDGSVKTSSDDKKDGDKTKDGNPDASAIISPAVAVDVNAVAVVVPVTTDSAPPAVDAQAADAVIEAIAGTSAPTATKAAGKTDPSVAIDGDVSVDDAATATTSATAAASTTPATPATSVTPKLATASAAEAATLSTPEAAIAAAGVATTATPTQATGKAKTAAIPGKAAASGKDDGKQAIDTSTTSAPSEHAVESSQTTKATKPTGDAGSNTEKPATDKTDATQDKVTTSADTSDSSQASAPKASTASATEHHAPTVAQPIQPLQPDPSVLLANNQAQPLQLNTSNVAAMPAPQLTAAALAANAPVPLAGLAADIALRAAGGNSRFEIRLDPAELGRIDVRLDVDKHGQVTSHLTVERPATLDMLRRDAPQLQQALEDAGLKTGNSGLQFSLRDQSSSGQQNDNGSGRQSQRLVITEENTVPAQVAERSYGRMLGSSGGVDIRV